MMRGTGRVRTSRALVVAVGVGMLGPLLAACGPDRSVEAFCAVYREEDAIMSKAYHSAGKNALGQLGVAAANLSEYNRMVHRLDDAAPAQIESDMRAAREAWDKQSDLVAGAAKDPLGTMAASFFSSLMASASYANVDKFALEHCGGTVFGFANLPKGHGTDGSAPTGSTATVSAAPPSGCPGAGDPPVLEVALTGRDAESLERLRSALSPMTASSDPDLAKDAAALKSAIDALPSARSAMDAMQRVRIQDEQANDDSTRTRLALIATLSTVCGHSAMSDLEAFNRSETTAIDDAAGNSLGTTFTGQKCDEAVQEIGWVAPYTHVTLCEAMVTSVEVTTGKVSRAALKPPGDLKDTRTTYGLAGSRIASITGSTTPPAGLEPERYSAQLVLTDLDGGNEITVPLLDKVTMPSRPGVTIGATGSSGTVTIVVEDTDKSTARVTTYNATTGARMASFPVSEYSERPWTPITGRVYVHDYYPLLDVTTGKPLGGEATGSLSIEDGGCLMRALTPDYQIVDDRTGISRSPQRDGDYESGGTRLGVTRAGVLYDDGGEIRMVSRTGKTLWRLPPTVADNARLTLGWPVIQNKAGKWLVVDPVTGKEAADLSDVVRDNVVAMAESAHEALSDPLRDWVLLPTGDTSWRIGKLSDYCR